MNPEKIELQPPKPSKGVQGGILSLPIRMALPYYQCRPGAYVHRIRSGQTHRLRMGEDAYHKRHPQMGQILHLSFSFWCGGSGHVSRDKPGRLFAEIPENGVLCATCEGRAIGAGLDGSPSEINGRAVIFSPRK